MYQIYKILTALSTPLLTAILNKRLKAGKEDPNRIREKLSIIDKPRPDGDLIWIHAASIGEAQSTLVIIDNLLASNKNLNIIVTTGTLTSAQIMEEKLPKPQAFHQFYPLDHPKWVARFANHWNPDCVIWMESELWPNMLHEIKRRKIPAFLINAHMSEKSFRSWKLLKSLTKSMLSAFNKVLCQTDIDKKRFSALGASNIVVTDNLKYSSPALTYDKVNLDKLRDITLGRVIWLYASTHAGEEEIACRSHIELKKQFPNLLTVIVPRHPDRRDDIKNKCSEFGLNIKFRGFEKSLPNVHDDIYIADTLGELGLFYRLAPLACIGRSFSDDGGGGHNPIEAAQLGCAVIHGNNVQNLQDIFEEMNKAKAAICIEKPENLSLVIETLLSDNNKMLELQNAGKQYAQNKNNVIDGVMSEIKPVLSILNAD